MKVTEHKMCIWFSLQRLSETFLILREKMSEMWPKNERNVTKKWAKCDQKWAKCDQKWAKCDPKMSEMWPKNERNVTKKWAKRDQKWAKRDQKWAKCDQKMSETWPKNERNVTKKWAKCDQKMSEMWPKTYICILIRLYLWNFNFLGTFSKNIQISNFMQIRPVGAELFRAGEQTGRQTWRSFAILRMRLQPFKKTAIKVLTAFSLTTDSRGIKWNEVERTYWQVVLKSLRL